jgi:hypothetical protein
VTTTPAPAAAENVAPAIRPSALILTLRATQFVGRHHLALPGIEVRTNGEGTKGLPPQAPPDRTWADMEPFPAGTVTVAFVRDVAEFVAWASAIDAARLVVYRDSPHYTRVAARAWDRSNDISWHVVGLLPHEYGARHLPGAGVDWWAPEAGGVTLDGLVAAYTATGHLPAAQR